MTETLFQYEGDFTCFIKIGDNKFDLVIKGCNTLTFKTFGDIQTLIDVILNCALNININDCYIFEITYSYNQQTELLIEDGQIVPNFSIITINHKPSPLSCGVYLSSGFELESLIHRTEELIKFYHIVQIMKTFFHTTSYKSIKSRQILQRVKLMFPNIITSHECRGLNAIYKKSIEFYLNFRNKFNFKIDLRLQRRFDLIKIIHILPENQFPNKFQAAIRKIGEESDIKQYLHYHKYYNYDINFKIYSNKPHSKSIEEFKAVYLEGSY